jgi:hypothetical protein
VKEGRNNTEKITNVHEYEGGRERREEVCVCVGGGGVEVCVWRGGGD